MTVRPALPSLPDWHGIDLVAFESVGLLRRDVMAADLVMVARGGRLCLLALPLPLVLDRCDLTQLSLQASHWFGNMACLGVLAVPPAVMEAEAHSVDLYGVLPPAGGASWFSLFAPLRDAARAVIIPPLPGWDTCPHVWAVAREALDRGRPVFLLSETYDEVRHG